jgi:hypothetical protein
MKALPNAPSKNLNGDVCWHSAFDDIVAFNHIIVDSLYHLFTALLDKKVKAIPDYPRTVYDRREGQGITVGVKSSTLLHRTVTRLHCHVLTNVYSTKLLCQIIPWNKFVPQECDDESTILGEVL